MNSRGGGEAARLEFELSPLTLCKIFTNVCPLDVTTEYEAISFSVTNFQDIWKGANDVRFVHLSS